MSLYDGIRAAILVLETERNELVEYREQLVRQRGQLDEYVSASVKRTTELEAVIDELKRQLARDTLPNAHVTPLPRRAPLPEVPPPPLPPGVPVRRLTPPTRPTVPTPPPLPRKTPPR